MKLIVLGSITLASFVTAAVGNWAGVDPLAVLATASSESEETGDEEPDFVRPEEEAEEQYGDFTEEEEIEDEPGEGEDDEWEFDEQDEHNECHDELLVRIARSDAAAAVHLLEQLPDLLGSQRAADLLEESLESPRNEVIERLMRLKLMEIYGEQLGDEAGAERHARAMLTDS